MLGTSAFSVRTEFSVGTGEEGPSPTVLPGLAETRLQRLPDLTQLPGPLNVSNQQNPTFVKLVLALTLTVDPPAIRIWPALSAVAVALVRGVFRLPVEVKARHGAQSRRPSSSASTTLSNVPT